MAQWTIASNAGSYAAAPTRCEACAPSECLFEPCCGQPVHRRERHQRDERSERIIGMAFRSDYRRLRVDREAQGEGGGGATARGLDGRGCL